MLCITLTGGCHITPKPRCSTLQKVRPSEQEALLTAQLTPGAEAEVGMRVGAHHVTTGWNFQGATLSS